MFVMPCSMTLVEISITNSILAVSLGLQYYRSMSLTCTTVISLDLAKANVLEKLKPVDMDGSGRTGCLENTRTDVLTMVINWASNPSTGTQRALWLHGPAGSGKSTISTTLADQLRCSKQLGAFFKVHLRFRKIYCGLHASRVFVL